MNHPPEESKRKRSIPKFPTDSGITEAQAKEHCKKVLEDSTAGKACKGQKGVEEDKILHNCVQDIKVISLTTRKLSVRYLIRLVVEVSVQ